MATSAVRQQRACVKQPAFVASLLLLSVALDFCCAEQVTCGSTTTTIGNYTSYTINQCATQTNIVGSNNSYLNTTFTVAGGTALPLISLQAQGELGYVTIDISGITASAFTPVGNAVGPIRISGDYVHHVTVRWTNVRIYNATSRASLVELLYLTAITPGLTGGHDIAVLVVGCVFELRGTWGVLSTVFQINTAFNAKSLSRTIINISSSQLVVSPTALRAGLREYVVRVGVPLNGTAVQQTNVTDLTLLIKDSQILSSFCRPQTTDQPCALVNLDDNLKLVPFSIAFSFFLRVSLRIDNSVVTAIHADSTRYQTTSLVSIFLFTNSRQDSAIPYGAGEQLTVVAQRSNLSISTTSEGQLLNAMYFEQLTSINVIVSNVTWYADAIGMYVLSKSYRNLEMIRILAVGTVTDLTVVVQDVSITHLETCGVYQLNQSMVDSFPNDMQGVASIAVHLGMSALTNALFNLTRIDMYTDCRNGSITGIVSAQLPVSLGFFGQSATVLTIEQSVLATGVTVHATDCHHKAHIGFAPFLFPAFQMALVGSSLCILSLQGFQTNMEVTVRRSSVEMLSMDFRLWPFASGADCRIGPNFPLAGPYRMFGTNVTSIIVAADLNNTQYVCLPALIKSARGMNTQVPAYHRNAHIMILSCVVTNPWAFLRSTDVTAFYVAPTLVDGVILVVNSSGTAVSPTNIGSSGVALMLLSSTTVSNSRFDVYNCTDLVTLLYGSASSSTVNNLKLTIIDSVFQRFTLAPGNEISSTPSYAIAPQPGSISSSVDVLITTTMILRDCAFNGYRGYADPAGTMLAEITGQCNTINGSRPKKQFLRTASVTDVAVFSGCGVGSSRTLTFPAPPNASTATQSTVQKAASAATASGVVAAGLVVATLSIPTGFGTVPLLQMSSSALRLRACCASSSLRSSDNGGGSDSSGSSSNGNAGIGTEVADNPLQISLGATLSYAGGTIVGNTVLVVGGALVVVVLQVVQRGVASWFGGKASRQQRHQR
ncbi:membrane-associated protein, putative, partial [Bodo saltans]